ncbi:MAG: hypothetical protein ABID35_04955 [Candidatus Margulisiibacteriota bacterium]
MALVQLILGTSIIAAVIFYFIKRSKKLNEMEMEERLKDEYR